MSQIKVSAASLWVLIATVIAIAPAIDMSSTKGLILASLGLVPPLAILLWNQAAPAMSQGINDARR